MSEDPFKEKIWFIRGLDSYEKLLLKEWREKWEPRIREALEKAEKWDKQAPYDFTEVLKQNIELRKKLEEAEEKLKKIEEWSKEFPSWGVIHSVVQDEITYNRLEEWFEKFEAILRGEEEKENER